MKRMGTILGTILSVVLIQACEDKPAKPSLTTATPVDITTTSAVSGGKIINDGGDQVISAGVCWNTAYDPTLENSSTNEGARSSTFTSSITQLSPKTTYYVRAYATNSAGTAYGNLVSFKTLGDIPSSDNLSASDITINSATFSGFVKPNMLSTTVAFEYGLTTGYGSTVTPPGSPLAGDSDVNVTAEVSGLTPGTTYHVRLKTENALGITFSPDLTFITQGKAPDISALEAEDIQIKAAKLSGSVNPNYLSSSVTFEWGTTSAYGNQVTPVQSPVTGSTPVDVSTILTGLAPGTTYHFRIISSNELGTSNSDDLTFKTLGQIPSLVSQTVTDVQITRARVNGVVNSHYLSTTVILEWGTTADYGNTLSMTENPIDGNSPVDLFLDLSGLTPETTYHFRIKATNELGTSTSEDMTCMTFAVADADNNYYHSITIGTQTWMKDNLKTTHFNNNNEIPFVTDNTEWSNLAVPAYCWYNNENTNRNIYGALYNWYSVSSGILCPIGWHVPDNSEWSALTDYLGGAALAGGKLKETNTVHWQNPNTDATNESGFTALPGGSRDLNGPFYNIGDYGYWWSATEASLSNSWYIFLTYYDGVATSNDYSKKLGYSVRCIKN